MNGDTCPKCNGRLLRDLELGAEYFGTVEVRKCINCGFVPGAQRAPSEEESASTHYRQPGHGHYKPIAWHGTPVEALPR
ncbi:MAG: hypothetical protein AB7L91_06470 [Dehalococcoidia bacterium]